MPCEKKATEEPVADDAQIAEAAVSTAPGDGSAAKPDRIIGGEDREKRGSSPYSTGGGGVTFAQPASRRRCRR